MRGLPQRYAGQGAGDRALHAPRRGGVCDEPRFEDAELDILLNPALLVEVLSESTAGYDRGVKFDHYRTIESLREVHFIAQDHVHVVRYERQPDDTWLLLETRKPGDRLALPSIEAKLRIAEVYSKVSLDEATGPTPVPAGA